MTDIASLVLQIDSSQVPKGTAALDNLTAAGKRAEGSAIRMTAAEYRAVGAIQQVAQATTKLTSQTNTAAASASRMAAQAQMGARAAMGMGNASGLARHHLQNLSFQLNDVAMALSTGQNPMRVFIQQGSQIAQIGQQAGVGVAGLAKAVLRMLAPFAGIAALAGGVLLAFKGVKDGAEEADAGAKNFIATLGLTRDEIKKLEDTGVTWGDVMGATFDVLAQAAGTSSDQVTSAWESAFTTLTEFSKFSIAVLLAGFAGLVRFVASAANDIGTLIGNGIAAGVNKGLEFIEKLINGVVAGVNSISGAFKALGVDMGSLKPVSLGRVRGGGSLSNPITDAKSQFYQSFSDVQGGFARIGAGANARRDRRLRGQANDIIADRDGKGAGGRGAHDAATKALNDETRATDAAMKAAQGYLDSITKETDGIGQDEIAHKRLEAATAAAAARKAAATAPTKEMKQALLDEADAIMKAEGAWETVFKNNRTADFIKNTVEPLEQQVRLLGLSAEAQAKANLEAEKGAIIAKYGADAWERYAAAQGKIIANDNKVKNPFEEWAATVPHSADQINAALQGIETRGFDNLAAAISDVVTGAKSLGDAFKDVAKSIISDIIQMTVRMLIFRLVSGMMGGGGATQGFIGPPSAKGNVFMHGSIVPHRLGGVVGSPTLFPMSGGKMGSMAEDGPEAIMPLARDGSGRLGVRSANNNEPIHIVITTAPTENAWATVDQIAAHRGSEAVQISVKHTNDTLRTIAKPKLMGGRG